VSPPVSAVTGPWGFSYDVTGASGRTKGELVVQLVPHP